MVYEDESSTRRGLQRISVFRLRWQRSHSSGHVWAVLVFSTEQEATYPDCIEDAVGVHVLACDSLNDLTRVEVRVAPLIDVAGASCRASAITGLQQQGEVSRMLSTL